MDLSGKVLVVTGSDGALGQAVAATLSRYGARLALGAAPNEAAEVIAFLLSDQARAVTGALIPVAGRV